MHRLGAVIPLLIGVFLVVRSYQLSLGSFTQPEPGLWPFLVGVVLVVSSGVLLFTERSGEDYERFTGRVLYIGLGLASLGAFIVGFAYLGFILPAFLTLAFWLRFLGDESWGMTLGLSALFTAVFYVLFVSLLEVPFPDDVVAVLWGGG